MDIKKNKIITGVAAMYKRKLPHLLARFSAWASKSSAQKLLLTTLIIFLVAVQINQNKSAIYNQLNDWKLIPRPERFTELYFNDHINLPKQIANGQTVSFSFVIHNLEGQPTVYPYAVYFKSLDGQVTTIEEKSVTLADNEFKTINEPYTSETDNNSGAVFVDLKDKQQDIHFLLNYNN